MEDRKNPSSFSHSRMFSLAFPVQGYKSLFYMSICNSNPKEKILYIIVCEQALSLGEKIARKGKGKAGRESLRSRPKKERARKRETREETPLAFLPLSRSFFLAPTTSKGMARRLFVHSPFRFSLSPQFPARPKACSQAIYTITLVSALLSPDHPTLPPFQNKVYKKYL